MNENSSNLSPESRPKRLYRSADDRKIAGVAGGLARHFDVDAAFVRLGFVALALFGGSGLVLYAVAWLIVPLDRDEVPAAPPAAEPPPATESTPSPEAPPVVESPPPDATPPITFHPMV